jgi:putative nucleotidyltransferase with HDIG domain
LCFAALVIFGIALGWVVGNAMERNMLKRAQEQTAEAVSGQVQANFTPEDFLAPKTGVEYDSFSRKAMALPLGATISKLKFWNSDGVVIWSQDRELVGKSFPDNEHMYAALGGAVATCISSPSYVNGKYNNLGGEPEGKVLELYVPITFTDTCEITGVVEVYEDMGPLYADITSHRRIVWFGVGGGFSLLFLVLYGIVSNASGKIQAQSAELKDIVVNLTSAMANALDAKSPWTMGHSERVGMYSEKVALKMGLPKADIRNLRIAGLLHDIGKIGTYDSLLEKPGRLTREEFEIVKKHPEQGAQILSGIKQLEDIIPLIAHHHERYDGQGYPAGIKGKDIPIGARILHVADSFEAITDNRPYRRARGYREAIREIKRHTGRQFDPEVVEAFLEVLRESLGIGHKNLNY